MKDVQIENLMHLYCICIDEAEKLVNKILDIHPRYLKECEEFEAVAFEDLYIHQVRQSATKKANESIYNYFFEKDPSNMEQIIEDFASLKLLIKPRGNQ